MKTIDLMLGDIITFKDSVETDKTPIPIKVIALGYQHHGNENEALVQIGDDIGEDKGCDLLEIDDDFAGYPLTPEILEKNGFESSPNIYGHSNYKLSTKFILENRGDRFCLSRLMHPYKSSTFFIMDVQFVHELQHILKLFWIEKEIVL